VDKLVASYPRLYHMAERHAWPSIRDKGLLSTAAVLDLFGANCAQRSELESSHRPEKVPIGDGDELRIV
jgi:hypothetical protein